MGKTSVRPKLSSIRDHVRSCNSDINMEHLKIIAFNNREIDLRVLESIFNIKDKPVLNENNSAFPLKFI